MNIYLDIDGVIMANDKQPALHADEFIQHIVGQFPVYWLTTHCRIPNDNPLLMLSRFFSGETEKSLKQIRPAYWETLKTEAINFEHSFLWFDDDPIPEELEELTKRGVFESWVEVDLAKNVNQLRDELMLPRLYPRSSRNVIV